MAGRVQADLPQERPVRTLRQVWRVSQFIIVTKHRSTGRKGMVGFQLDLWMVSMLSGCKPMDNLRFSNRNVSVSLVLEGKDLTIN